MLTEIDHIGILVNDLDKVRDIYGIAFGLQPDFEEEVASQKIKMIGYHIGDTTIEFFQPISPDSPVANFLKSRGNNIHHIAFRVQDLDQKLAELLEKNFILIDEKTRLGANGKKIAFLHPKSFDGILIELCE
jgi:methylmalonyl-CoA/ethylmalonyl-CoA epimerase